ncbi:MAG: hypothetical protein NPIRA03_30530 [Nitrospirales bacterium]|nr:MAG: hypothetical protein NPIRA03_30530 [Nitrospirales bacterium]
MKTLYVNNFRGFADTYIPLKDVNFLIGENSTGKTSILSLIKILSDPRFLLTLNFQSEELDLGNFEDIVSYLSGNKKSFTVGLVVEDDSVKSKKAMFLITFKNKQDIPVIDTYSFATQNGLIHIKRGKKSITYKYESQLKLEDGCSVTESLFRKSLLEHRGNSKDYKSLPSTIREKFEKAPIGFILDTLESFVLKNVPFKERTFRSPTRVIEEVTWIAPIREKPKRTYDQYKFVYSPEGTHTPYLLNDFLGDRGKKQYSKLLLKGLEEFGIDSELFKTIQVKRYGRHKTAPFELDVVLSEKPLKISNVGYGIAQVLPILVECFLRTKSSEFAIQQPEVHLHPKAQASLGNFFHSLANSDKKKFFIETHSDFLIDRFRRMQIKDNPVPAQVLFFERTKIGNTVHAIDIDKNGKYGERQPENFRNFFIKEELEMLSL